MVIFMARMMMMMVKRLTGRSRCDYDDVDDDDDGNDVNN